MKFEFAIPVMIIAEMPALLALSMTSPLSYSQLEAIEMQVIEILPTNPNFKKAKRLLESAVP